MASIGFGLATFRCGRSLIAPAGRYCTAIDTTHRQQLYLDRLSHVRQHMRTAGVGAMLLLDPVSIRYVTGASNMENFTVRVPSRYLLVVEPGPSVLYEYKGCGHLSAHLPTIDDVRLAFGLNVVSSDARVGESCQGLVEQVIDVLRDVDRSIDLIAVDRLPFQAIDALRAVGMTLVDADEILVPARARKLPIEIVFMREVMRRTEAAMAELEQAIRPGVSEMAIWAEFHRGHIARGGDFTVSRLCQSGERTFPYFQECSDRILQVGDLLCLDSDAVGLEGYCADLSRTFLCGDVEATSTQRTLYGRAREQLEHNAALLAPGVSYEDIARGAWPIPVEHQASRYYCIGHGLGVAGDFPNIPHLPEAGPYPVSGELEPGMVFCIESYIGSIDAGQGVKLEDEYLITESGVERLSSYPFDQRLGPFGR